MSNHIANEIGSWKYRKKPVRNDHKELSAEATESVTSFLFVPESITLF